MIEATWFDKQIGKLNKKELLEVVSYLLDDKKRRQEELDLLGDNYYEMLATKKLHGTTNN